MGDISKHLVNPDSRLASRARNGSPDDGVVVDQQDPDHVVSPSGIATESLIAFSSGIPIIGVGPNSRLNFSASIQRVGFPTCSVECAQSRDHPHI